MGEADECIDVVYRLLGEVLKLVVEVHRRLTTQQ